jgi:predicted nucleotidyltransferase
MKTIEERIRYIIEKVLIQSKITLKDIIIFGSRARGGFDERSDFDILIIIKNDMNIDQKRSLWKEVYHALHRDFPIISFDVIIKTTKDFEDEKNVVNTISNEACIEGIKI